VSATDRLSAALADRYRIERELGSGGMATVYLAEDLKHKRKVALKVLKPELAAVLGAERFVQEITTTASLQHPHILPLFDSGTADGFLYYVMPFIQGETLRDRLNRETQLGVDDAVKIAVEVADALQYAHEQGVIHRDIKPENILLANGRPMVADFGIALAVSAAAGGRMTETGLSLGTPHYMSPEQATAEKEITARSDVYSLASVLYEMLAGQPPHLGGSAQQIIMKIIAEPVPAVTTLRKAVPPNVAAALAKALEKLPADRFESARAFAGALGNSAFSTPAVATQVGIRPSQDWRSRVALPATGLSIILAAPVIWMVASRPGPAPVSRYEVAWPGTAPLNVNVSPDGSLLVIRSRPDSTLAPLLLKHRDALDATPIPGTAGAYNTAFSPDGGRIAFMVSSNIMTVDVRGGVPLPVMDTLVGSPGLDWGPDGYIYFDRYGAGPLMRVPEGGGPTGGDLNARHLVRGIAAHLARPAPGRPGGHHGREPDWTWPAGREERFHRGAGPANRPTSLPVRGCLCPL
jgi:serine/threonine-protein kinase